MDEFAFYDIPNSIDYILATTSSSSLSYVGFSQGTAQAFAALAVHPLLNEKVDVFIALAPAMSPAGLSNGIVDALIKASPQVLFLLFGRRSILSSATMWQSILYPPIFVRAIDMGLRFLFGWHAKNMSPSQKLAAYPHLYSFTSTKAVVHWFQIIRTKTFQMYDDDVQAPLSLGSVSKYTKVAKFPTRNIKTPIVLVYGGSDSLVDINVMLKELPRHTVATEIPHYEHLDFLWAREVDTLVFPHVLDALESFTTGHHTKEEYARYRAARHLSLGVTAQPLPPAYASEDDKSPIAASYAAIASVGHESNADDRNQLLDQSNSLVSGPRSIMASGITTTNGRKRARLSMNDGTSSASTSPTSPVHIKTARAVEPGIDGAIDEDLTSPAEAKLRSMRSESPNSMKSFESQGLKLGRGISLGIGKALGGVVSRTVEGRGNLTSTSSDENWEIEHKSGKRRK